MLNIPLVGCKIDCKSKEFHCSYVGMWKENQFYNVVHTIGVCKRVPDCSFCWKQVQYIKSSHSIGRILSKKVDELGNESGSFDSLSSSFVEAEIVIDHEWEVE